MAVFVGKDSLTFNSTIFNKRPTCSIDIRINYFTFCVCSVIVFLSLVGVVEMTRNESSDYVINSYDELFVDKYIALRFVSFVTLNLMMLPYSIFFG